MMRTLMRNVILKRVEMMKMNQSRCSRLQKICGFGVATGGSSIA